ncbi:MAG: YlxR family protein [Mycobacteriales bacterium]
MGCRERTAQAALLRVVAVEDYLVLDAARRLPGRGAHLHPDLRCLDLAEKRRAFPRALRLAGPLDATALRSAVTAPALPAHAPTESRHR